VPYSNLHQRPDGENQRLELGLLPISPLRDIDDFIILIIEGLDQGTGWSISIKLRTPNLHLGIVDVPPSVEGIRDLVTDDGRDLSRAYYVVFRDSLDDLQRLLGDLAMLGVRGGMTGRWMVMGLAYRLSTILENPAILSTAGNTSPGTVALP